MRRILCRWWSRSAYRRGRGSATTGPTSATTRAACGTRRSTQINRENVSQAAGRLDVPHRRRRRGQDDRVHADRRRRRDVRHDRARRGWSRSTRRPARRSGSSTRTPVPRPSGGRNPASGGVNRGVAYWSRRQRTASAGHPRDVGRAAVLARREDRQARPGVRRRRRPSTSARGTPTERDLSKLAVRPDVGAGGLREPRHRRVLVRRGPLRRAGGRPGVRRPHRQGGLAVPHRPAAGRVRHETWEADAWKDRGGANAWGGLTRRRRARHPVLRGPDRPGLDFYGGDRQGDNLFANCTLALDARTGKRLWHFQTVHHDLWDHDNPCPPVVCTVKRDGKTVDAVAQVTKTGYCFLFDREDRQAAVRRDGDDPCPPPTSPARRRARPSPCPSSRRRSRGSVRRDDVTDYRPRRGRPCSEQLKKLRTAGRTRRPAMRGTVVIPGFHGGANWSGASFDPTTGLLYVNSNNAPNVTTLAIQAGPRADGYSTSATANRYLRRVPATGGLPGHQAALGPADRDRPEHRRVRLAGHRSASSPS